MDTKRIADGLTFSRGLAGLAIVWLGFARGGTSVEAAAWLLLYSWSSDLVDGPLARRSQPPRETWIGRLDLEVDILVSAGLLAWLSLAGVVPLYAAGLYVGVWAIVFARFGRHRSLGMLVQGPIYAGFIAVALRNAPAAGAALVAWILAAIAVTWPRFPREIVPEFVAGIRGAWEQLRRARQ